MDDPAHYRPLALMRRQVLLSLVAATATSCTKFEAVEDEPSGISHFPQTPDSNCRNGASRIYDECGSQIAIYEAALAQAIKSNKTLLISYGAEWCIWCHVFDAYLSGRYGEFDYRYNNRQAVINENGGSFMSGEAVALNRYAKDNFVLAHIEADHARDGEDVLGRSGAARYFTGALPFIFSTNGEGKWAATFDYRKAETRRDGHDWFRGYDRGRLLTELKAMRTAAVAA